MREAIISMPAVITKADVNRTDAPIIPVWHGDEDNPHRGDEGKRRQDGGHGKCDARAGNPGCGGQA